MGDGILYTLSEILTEARFLSEEFLRIHGVMSLVREGPSRPGLLISELVELIVQKRLAKELRAFVRIHQHVELP
jgi:hypothetical protein